MVRMTRRGMLKGVAVFTLMAGTPLFGALAWAQGKGKGKGQKMMGEAPR